MTTRDIAMNFTLSALIISANVIIAVALCYMKTAKRTTIVFLSQLTICNTVQGFILFSRGILFIYHVQTSDGCLVSILITLATTGHYVTCIFYVYLDLFLSLKKMSVTRPVISSRLALGLSLLSGLAWIGLGAIGYAFRNDQWHINPLAGCTFGTGQHLPSYIIFVLVLFLTLFILIFVSHLMTLRLMKKAYAQMSSKEQTAAGVSTVTAMPAVGTLSVRTRKDSIPKDKKTLKKKSSWLKKNAAVMKMMLIILTLFIVCWYPLLVLILVMNLCHTCVALIPKGALYFAQVLVVIQYVSNGLIYLVNIKEFKDICKRICCFCFAKYRVYPQLPSQNSDSVRSKDNITG